MFLFFLVINFFCSWGNAKEKESWCFYENTCEKDVVWYGKFQVGYAYSYTSYLFNPDPAIWDVALEGYAASLGGAPYVLAGLGGNVLRYLDIDVSCTYYQNFHYQKHQTGNNTTQNFSGQLRNRFFSLTHQNVIFSATFSPKEQLYISLLELETTFFAGMGIGCGFSRVFPFYTVGYNNGVGSVANAGLKRESTSFAWQGSCGLRIHPKDSCCSLDLGYMFYDGGPFKVSEELSVNDKSLEGDLDKVRPLRGYLKTNQITISFQCLF
jgi:hypothetical protein